MAEDGWWQWWQRNVWAPSSPNVIEDIGLSVTTFGRTVIESGRDNFTSSQRRRKPDANNRRLNRQVIDTSSGRNCTTNASTDTPTPCKSIFELYEPWAHSDIKKDIESLPELQKQAFENLLLGNKQLESVPYILSWLSIPDFDKHVDSTDIKGRTLLHFACAFGNFDVVDLLLLKGANPSVVDSTNCITPLICAAVIGDERIMKALLTKNADINQGLDNFKENCPGSPLHWAVRAENISAVKFLLERGACVTGTFINRETPLHEAASSGNHRILELLLQYGSKYMELRGGFSKGKLHGTALHVAVERGHESCVEVLLAAGASANSRNAKGQTPLHIAAITADFEAIRLLLLVSCGDPDLQDHFGRIPLHYCALNSIEYQHQTTQCLELLLEKSSINIQDELGYTAFHLAVMYDNSPVAAILLRHGADLTVRIQSGQSGLEILVKKMPHAIRYVKESLDLAMTLEDKAIDDPKCSVILDFRAIVTRADRKVPDIPTFHRETEFLTSLIQTGHKSILSHPLIEAFLVLKWQKVRKYFWASFLANLLMVVTYSWFLYCVYNNKCPIQAPKETQTSCQKDEETALQYPYVKTKTLGEFNTPLEITWILLLAMAVIFAVKEVLQMIQSLKTYAKRLENYIQMFFLVTIVVTTWPVGKSIWNKDCICDHLKDLWEYRLAAIAIPVAWLLVLLRIGRLPRLGLYVQMLFRVVLNFVLFMTAYASIVIAFALSFSILFSNKREFENPLISLLNVLIMMTGEVDIKYVVTPTRDTNYQCNNTAMNNDEDYISHPLQWVTNVMYACFVLLVTVVLMNLLVGLAVSDIQGLHDGAKVARLSRLVVAISQLESVLFSKGPIKIIPTTWRRKLQRSALVVPSDDKQEFTFRPHDPRDTLLSQSLQMEILGIVEAVTSEKLSNRCQVPEALDPRMYKRMKNVEKTLDSLEGKVDKIFEMLASLKLN